jgi:hypothetical protein
MPFFIVALSSHGLSSRGRHGLCQVFVTGAAASWSGQGHRAALDTEATG